MFLTNRTPPDIVNWQLFGASFFFTVMLHLTDADPKVFKAAALTSGYLFAMWIIRKFSRSPSESIEEPQIGTEPSPPPNSKV